MTYIGNLIFLALAFALGMIIYTTFMISMYYVFIKETQEENIDSEPDLKTMDEVTSNMEEINIDDI